MDELNVTNNEAQSRYEVTVDGVTAIADYQRRGNEIVFTHTEVPPALEGRGVGSALARAALDDARAKHLTVVSRCWFISEYIKDNPEFQDLLTPRA